MYILKIVNLHARIKETQKEILQGIDLVINPGEVHAIMGPNGSGKSTLSKVMMGHPDYEITKGDIFFKINGQEKSLVDLLPHERALEGLFLGFQYPVEVPGVSNSLFLRESFNEVCRHHGVDTMDSFDFRDFLQSKLDLLGLDESFLERGINEGFSGGEKKKNEILQLLLLNPKLAILDETDSGLDVDALKIVSQGVNSFKSKFNSTILITHYQRLLDYIQPDFVHILSSGKIIQSGDKELAKKVEESGYSQGLLS